MEDSETYLMSPCIRREIERLLMDNNFSALTAISPIDGRYRPRVAVLADYFSEQALIKHRLEVEINYFIYLSKIGIIKKIPPEKKRKLLEIITKFSNKDAVKIKKIEETINHDAKAVEYFLRKKINQLTLPTEYLHFALTTYDIDTTAYSLAIKRSRDNIILPSLKLLIREIKQMAELYKGKPMLGRTHGQPAVPTTMGKELMVFAIRLFREYQELKSIIIEAKLNGAVGNYNAHFAAFPNVNWLKFSADFIDSLGLKPNLFTTQIMPYDSFIKIFQSLFLINQILIGFDQDLWRYISDDYFLQKIEEKQVGSSTMPQKVNPIDLENSEGNLGIANSLLGFLIQKLAISRLQRDLSDKTVKRNIGMAFAYSLLGYQSTLKGLNKLSLNEKFLKEELLEHWEIITEGIQTILRTGGDIQAYEKLKEFSQGKKLDQNQIKNFVEDLKVNPKTKKQLLNLTPLNYLGLAEKLVDEGIKIIKF